MSSPAKAGDPVRRGLSVNRNVSGILDRPLKPGDDSSEIGELRTYLIGGAYWMPPLLHSEFSPRGIFSFDPSPTLRS